jgi:ubiquinone/menaquinone biosynthesis C-methylase UbiE
MVQNSSQDIWAQWLLKRRFGGDPERMKIAMEWLYRVRDKVLSQVHLKENETLLDVGCGDGLIAFGALEKFPGCHVIFSDISQDLLDHAEALAREMNVVHRCRFVKASADDLSLLPDRSVEAVTTRSVLIYVSPKGKAFGEFHRVLKDGGMLSIFEPINRFASSEWNGKRFGGFDVSPVMDLAQKVEALYTRLQPDTDPMLDFDERDLFSHAESAGFFEVHLELQAEVKPLDASQTDWDAFLHTAGNPRIPTLAEAMDETLALAEIERFTAHLRPLVESGQGTRRFAVAYLWAVK